MALALPLVFYLADLLMARIKHRQPVVHFKGLLLASALTMATHPILDWSNNYGMRFLLPWSPRWFYGDFLFVIDPVFWLVLGGSAFLLTSITSKQISVWLVIGVLTTALEGSEAFRGTCGDRRPGSCYRLQRCALRYSPRRVAQRQSSSG